LIPRWFGNGFERGGDGHNFLVWFLKGGGLSGKNKPPLIGGTAI